MSRWTLIGGLAVAIALLVGLYVKKQSEPPPYGRADVVAVWLEPYPEGPSSPKFVSQPRGRHQLPLALVQNAVPSPLPRDVWQGFRCDLGGNVVVELDNGERIDYGPCRRPASIARLRTAILDKLQPASALGCSGLGAIRSNYVDNSQVHRVLRGHVPSSLPADLDLFRVFKGYDTGAVWTSPHCRLLLILVADYDIPQIDRGWRFLGRSTHESTVARGFGDYSLTVHTRDIGGQELHRILQSM